MGRTPDNPEPGRAWRGRPVVNPQGERLTPVPLPPAPPGIGDDEPRVRRPPDGGGSGPRWGIILSVIFGLIAVGMFVWIIDLSAELQDTRDAREAAEAEAVTAATQRNQAIEAGNAAVDRANQEIALREAAQTEEQAAQELAQQETLLRISAEGATRRAESARDRAILDSERQALRREEAVSTLALERVKAARDLALELARTNTTVKAIATGELRFYIEPLPWDAADGVQDAVDDIVDSLEALEPHGARVAATTRRTDADIGVRWVRDYGDHILGRAVHQTVIHVGLGSTNCHDEWQAFDADTIKNILWHEFGHAFGYGHSDNPNNVMYPETETRFAVEQDISEVIAAGWYHTRPFCDAGRYALEIETESVSDDFEFAVLPSNVTVDDYLFEFGEPNYSCDEGEFHRVTDTCRVHWGDRVVIYNDDADDAIRISGQIILLDEPPRLDMQWDEDAFYYDEDTLDYYRALFAEE